MKKYSSVVLLFVFACLAGNPAFAQSTTEAGFEKIKSLSGDWEGVRPDGKKVEVSYEVMSGGSAVVETLKPTDEPTMVTVYHMDGDQLRMTHYCSAGNQPRMVATMSGEKTSQIDFNLHDVTNLESPSEGHMKNLTLKLTDKDNLTQVWTFSQGDNAMPATFNLKRKKTM